MANTTTKLGRMGELSVAIDLLKKGWNVYEPVVDDHGVDLVAEKNNTTHYVQVKSHSHSKYQQSKPSIEIRLRKPSKANIMAVPMEMHRCICYIPIMTGQVFFSIAYREAKNKQNAHRQWYEDYLEVPE